MAKNKKKRRKTSSPTRSNQPTYISNREQQELAKAEKFIGRQEFNRASQIVEKILQKDPGHPQALGVQGQIFYRQGDYDRAISCQQEALKRKPNDPVIYFNLGVFLAKADRQEEALDAYRQALRVDPNYTNAYINMGVILHKRRDLDRAIATFEKARKIKPDLGHAFLNLGEVYSDKGNFEQAIDAYEKGIALLPNSPNNLNNLGILYRKTQQGSMAIDAFQKALDLDPSLIATYNNLGSVYVDQGRLDEAFSNFRKSLELDNSYFLAITNYLFCLNYPADLTASEIYEEHIKCGKFIEQKAKYHRRTHNRPIQDHNRIKIGYVSPDFRRHAVANFIGPILSSHNKKLFEIVCYFSGPHPDENTLQFKKMADKWRDIFHLNDLEVASLIESDHIDILVDLVGHTAHSRLEVFAMKPAPIQVTYLGYPNTTGMKTIDYRLTDQYADPVGQTEHFHTETLVRLPDCFLCYGPTTDPLTINDLPTQTNGYVTFASFNNRPKITDQVVTTWSQILKKVPNSKLLLKSVHLTDEKAKNHLLHKFTTLGIEKERIDIRGALQNYTDHLKLYNQVDIALDTFPYNGTTTTFEALWMGVPVITIEGKTHVSRVSTSILSQINLENFVANNEEEYIGLAIALANDPEQLATLRQSLRPTLTSSPACNASRFTQNLENTYQEMVATWNKQFSDIEDTDQDVCSSSEEYSLLGEKLFKANQFEEAKEALKKAIELDPNNEIALNNLGVLLWQAADLQAAMTAFQQALTAKPDYVNAIDNLAALLDSVKNNSGTQPQQTPANQPLETSPLVQFGEELLAQKKFTEAAQAFEKAIQANPADDIAYNNLGIVHWQTGNLQEAIKSFSKAIKINPRALIAINNMKACLKNLYNGQGQAQGIIQGIQTDSQAPKHAEQAIEDPLPQKGKDTLLEQQSVRLLNQSGEEYVRQAKFEEAIDAFKKAITIEPHSKLPHNNLGVVYWQLGKIQEAIACFRQALKCDPIYSKALHNLQQVLKKSSL